MHEPHCLGRRRNKYGGVAEAVQEHCEGYLKTSPSFVGAPNTSGCQLPPRKRTPETSAQVVTDQAFCANAVFEAIMKGWCTLPDGLVQIHGFTSNLQISRDGLSETGKKQLV